MSQEPLTPQSGSNITVGGETLEEWVAKKEAKETTKSEEIEAEVKKKSFYKSPRKSSYADKKGHGEVKHFPQSEINKLNWKETLLMTVEKKKSLAEKIIAVLLQGTFNSAESTSKAIALADPDGKVSSSKDIGMGFYRLYKSQLGHFLNRTGKGSLFTYQLNRYGRELSPKQLYMIYHKNFGLDAWNIVEQCPRLKELGYQPPEGSPEQFAKKKRKKANPLVDATPGPDLSDPDYGKGGGAADSGDIDILVKTQKATNLSATAVKKGLELLKVTKEDHEVNLNINVKVSFSFSID